MLLLPLKSAEFASSLTPVNHEGQSGSRIPPSNDVLVLNDSRFILKLSQQALRLSASRNGSAEKHFQNCLDNSTIGLSPGTVQTPASIDDLPFKRKVRRGV